jgi:murein biosynthesis integral membrane protein MurJ
MPEPFSDTITQPLPITAITTQRMPVASDSAALAVVRLSSPKKNIFRALISLASASLLIRLMGLVYQVIVTGRFGLGDAMDAYFVASLAPSMVAQLIASTVEYSVVPVFTRVRTQEGRKKASELFSTLLNVLLLGTLALMVVVFLLRKQVVYVSAPALDPSRADLAVGLMIYIVPVLVLQVVIALIESILNAEGQFGWPAYAGMLVPLTTAVVVLVASRQLGIVALCIGAVLGLCLQLVVFFIRLRRAKLVYRPVVNLRNPAVVSVLAIAGPALLTSLIIQLGPLVDQMFASSLSSGSISALNYALKLNSVPVGILFVSAGRAVVPYLSYQAERRDMDAFKETLRLYLWVVVIVTLALSAFMTLLAHPIVQILFQRGAFTAEDTSLTASTLIGFTVGLTPMAFGFILSKAFNALSKTRILMGVTIFSVSANAIFDSIFARLWQSTGIALATSAVYCCTMIILLVALRRTIGKLHLLTPPAEVLNVLFGLRRRKNTTSQGIRAPHAAFSLEWPSQWSSLLGRAGVILAAFAAGIIGIYYNALYALKVSVGAVIILLLLRYPYVLLLAWALINAFIGSNLSIFNGNNFLTALTVPTLLLMACMPVKQTLKRLPALIFLAVYLVWVFAGIRLSPLGTGPFLTLWLNFVDFAAVSVLVIYIITTQRRLLGLIDAILVPATYIALYGIYGYLTKQNGVLDSTGVFRAYSIYNAAPSLALLLSIIIPMAIYRTFTLRGIKRLIGLMVTLILLAAVVVTFSRGAFLSLPVGIFIMICFLPSKMRKGMLSAFVTVAVVLILLQTAGHIPLFDRFFSQNITSFNGRTYLWQALLQDFDPTQLLGHGLLASNAFLATLSVGNIATAPSNLFIGTLYDHGIIGVILLSLIFIALLVSLVKGAFQTTGERRMLFAAAIAALICVLFQSQESNDFWIQAIAIYFWIFMALPFANCWLTPEPSLEQSTEAGNKTIVKRAVESEVPAAQPPTSRPLSEQSTKLLATPLELVEQLRASRSVSEQPTRKVPAPPPEWLQKLRASRSISELSTRKVPAPPPEWLQKLRTPRPSPEPSTRVRDKTVDEQPANAVVDTTAVASDAADSKEKLDEQPAGTAPGRGGDAPAAAGVETEDKTVDEQPANAVLVGTDDASEAVVDATDVISDAAEAEGEHKTIDEQAASTVVETTEVASDAVEAETEHETDDEQAASANVEITDVALDSSDDERGLDERAASAIVEGIGVAAESAGDEAPDSSASENEDEDDSDENEDEDEEEETVPRLKAVKPDTTEHTSAGPES